MSHFRSKPIAGRPAPTTPILERWNQWEILCLPASLLKASQLFQLFGMEKGFARGSPMNTPWPGISTLFQ